MSDDMITLKLTHGEASALSYFIAFAALKHEKHTTHEADLIDKVSRLDPDSFMMWQAAVMKADRLVHGEVA